MLIFTPASPVQKLDLPETKGSGIDFYVKRDDLIHPFISGNKWRKLKFILEKAKREKKNHLVTFGGAWSNHLLATACLCAMTGMKSTGYVRGEEVVNPVLQLCKTFGMNLIFTERTAYRDKPLIFSKHRAEKGEAFYIEEGGFSPEGALGCQEVIQELTDSYDHIFCASGTGATVAGIAYAAQLHQKNAQVHSIPVLKGGQFIRQAAQSLYPNLSNLTLHTEYHFGGYAKSTPELIAFIKEFSSSTGILIEPVYTGKVFFAVQDLFKKGVFRKGEKILIVHTGGITGFLGNAHLF